MAFRATIAALCILLGAHAANAQDIYTEAQYQKVISLALTQFWGNARLSDGSFVRPATEEERKTLPIPYPHAKRVVDYSIPAGLAVWCGMDHTPYYTLYMRVERQRRIWTEKQVAFIGFLFGVSQGTVEGAFRSRTCDDPTRAKVTATLQANMESLQRLLK